MCFFFQFNFLFILFLFHFLVFSFFCFSFFVLVFLFLLFSFFFFSESFFFLFFFSFFFFFLIWGFFLKRNQMKTAWPRAYIVPNIYHDGRGLTYAYAAAVFQIKQCKKFSYFTFPLWKDMKHYYSSKNMAPVLPRFYVISI